MIRTGRKQQAFRDVTPGLSRGGVKNTMKRFFPIAFLFLLWTATSCAPVYRKPPVSPQPARAVEQPPLFPKGVIDRKIDFFGRLLSEKDLSPDDRRLAAELLDIYQSLETAAGTATQGARPLSDAEYRRLVRSLFSGLGRLDERYFSTAKPPGTAELLRELAKERDRIMADYLAGDFKGVIRRCARLKEQYGPDALSPGVALAFTLALGNQGMVKEAAELAREISKKIGTAPDIISLRAGLAEWEQKLGHPEAARRVRNRLVDDLDEREQVLKRVDQKLAGRQERVAGGPPAAPAGGKETGGVEESRAPDSPLSRLMGRVDSLVERHAFDEARLLLIKHRLTLQEGPEAREIDRALERVEKAESQFESEKTSPGCSRIETLDAVSHLIEQEAFEQAVARADAYLNDRPADADMAALRDRAIRGIINRDRNRAARLFLAARKTPDPLKKAEYLKASFALLNSLLEKYPSSTLINKVKSNIKSVREEMARAGITP